MFYNVLRTWHSDEVRISTMTMQIHEVSLEVLTTLTLVRHIDADEASARKRLRKICDITPSLGSSSVEKYFRSMIW